MLQDFLLGLVAGLAGLMPFLHTNTVLQFIQGSSVFVVALAFSHMLFEALPAVFFALPSASHNVVVLPAHKMVLEGKGVLALRTIIQSCFLALLLAALFAPFLLLALPGLHAAVKPLTGWVLALLLAAYLLSEKAWRKAVLGAGVFALSGVFGYLVFSSSFVSEPLFPLLTGLFGVPSLLLALEAKPLRFEATESRLKPQWGLLVAGVLLGAFSPLLPGLSPAFLGAVAFLFLESAPQAFLVLSSAIASSKMFYDFASVQAIGVARSGAAAAVKSLGVDSLFLLLAAGLASFFLATALLLAVLKPLTRFLKRMCFKNLLLALLLGIALACLAFGGLEALFVLGIASAIGMIPLMLGLRRSYSLGALLLPAMAYAFGLV